MSINEDTIVALKDLLVKDVSHTKALIDVLKQESESLKKRSFPNLPEITHQKQTLIDTIAKNNQQRYQLLAEVINCPDQTKLFKEFLAKCARVQANELKNINLQLEKNLNECRDINNVNGQVIAISLKNNQELLDILQGKVHAENVYGADGNIKGRGYNNPSSSGRHEEA